jgi:hypothetical protein
MPTDPFDRRPSWSPLILIWGLFGVSVTGLALGALVLPNVLQPTQAALPPQTNPGLAVIDDRTAVPDAVTKKPAQVVRPSPSPAPPRPFHPLDQAPKVVPQLPPGGPYDLAAAIDGEIDRALAAAGVPASPLADDAEFFRRVTLDLTGTVPTFERATAFLLDSDPYKRAAVIDELLDSPAYGKHFAHTWADLLIKRDFDANRNLRTEPFVAWLSGRFNNGAGWNGIVTDILTARGTESDASPVLFYLANQENNQPSPAKLAGATANLFLGVQLQCAECHVHPTVGRWGQQDFWGLAVFFSHLQFEREGGAKAVRPGAAVSVSEVERQAAPRGKAAKKNGGKEIKPGAVIAIPDPTDNRKTVGAARARFFEGPAPALARTPYRPALAAWLTSPQNKYFAPAAVNRVWAHLFARGLVHPVEEMHPDNAPAHPAVFGLLADDFVQSGYDVKRLIRVLCNTRVYQRTSRPVPGNSEDDRLLSHMPVKVIGARELLDALATVTGRREPESTARRPMRPAQKGDPGPVSLARFFDTRAYDDDPTEYPYGVPQILKLMNTGLTNRAADVARRIAKAANGDRHRAIEDLYLTALTRRPRPEEIERMLAFVATQDDPAEGYAGVLWALLNSAEFVSNH